MYVRPRPRFRPRNAGGVPFSPALLFTSGVAGAWYDPSDTSTLFQDSAGTTPVTAVEQPVGLMLDKSQGLVLGSELVTNGDFASASGWTLPGTGTNSITGGQAVLSGASGYLLRTGTSITAGNWYRVSFTVSGYSGSGTVRPYIQASPVFGSNVTGNGTFVQYLLATATNASTEVGLNFGTSFTGNIDDISIKSIAGNHALQATSASRPVLRARYNLLTYSEQFDNAAWSISGVTRSNNTQTAPDGTVTAETITGSSGTSAILFTTSGYTALAGNLTVSTYIKAGTADYAVLSLWAGSGIIGVNFWVNVQTGAVGSNSVTAGYTFVSGSSTAVGNGWYRVVLTGTVPAGIIYYSLRLVDGDNAFNYTNTVGKTLFVWGADLRTGSSAGTYQRIAAATDYATAGFLPYLSLDGTDDSIATGSINFTATDKMSVVAGLTKLSTASVEVILETSSLYDANPGAFVLAARGAATDYFGFKGGTSGTYNDNLFETAAVPVTFVFTGTIDINQALIADESDVRLNGATTSQSHAGTVQTGNFGNYPLYIGRRGGTTLPFNGRVYQIVVCGKTLSASELASTEAYVNARTGAY